MKDKAKEERKCKKRCCGRNKQNNAIEKKNENAKLEEIKSTTKILKIR